MTVIHIVMAPQYLNSNHVTYYVITCKSAFDWVYAEQWYVIITSDVNWTATRIPSQINSQELVYKQVMSIPVKHKSRVFGVGDTGGPYDSSLKRSAST